MPRLDTENFTLRIESGELRSFVKTLCARSEQLYAFANKNARIESAGKRNIGDGDSFEKLINAWKKIASRV